MRELVTGSEIPKIEIKCSRHFAYAEREYIFLDENKKLQAKIEKLEKENKKLCGDIVLLNKENNILRKHLHNFRNHGSYQDRCIIVDKIERLEKENKKMRSCHNCNYLKFGVCKADKVCNFDGIPQYESWEIISRGRK